ncbi:hypothetical protein ABK040_010213 [Willaertia magna]
MPHVNFFVKKRKVISTKIKDLPLELLTEILDYFSTSRDAFAFVISFSLFNNYQRNIVKIKEEFIDQYCNEDLFTRFGNWLFKEVANYYGNDVVNVIIEKILNFYNFNESELTLQHNNLQKINFNYFELNEQLSEFNFKLNNKDNFNICMIKCFKFGINYLKTDKEIVLKLRNLLNLENSPIDDLFENVEEFYILQRDFYYQLYLNLSKKFNEINLQNNTLQNNLQNNNTLQQSLKKLIQEQKVNEIELQNLIGEENFTKYGNELSIIINNSIYNYNNKLNNYKENYIINKYKHLNAEQRLTNKLLITIFIKSLPVNDIKPFLYFDNKKPYGDEDIFSDDGYPSDEDLNH